MSASDLFTEQAEYAPQLEVMHSQLIERQRTNWRDLMAGFTHFRGVTFSSSIPALLEVADLFDDAEIIFASERTLTREHAALEAATDLLNNYTFVDALADETALIPALAELLGRRGRSLLDRVANGSLRFRLMRKTPSHEKLYLLSGPNGTRVITGSANLSLAALSGRQREIFVVYDETEAHEVFSDILDVDCGTASPIEAADLVVQQGHARDRADPESQASADFEDGEPTSNDTGTDNDNSGQNKPAYRPRTEGVEVENVPIARALEAGVTIVEEPAPRMSEMPTLTAKGLREASRIGQRLRDLPLQPDKRGRTIITSKHFKRAWRTHRAQPVDETTEQIPRLRTDLVNRRLHINETTFFDGSVPCGEEITRDAKLLGDYFDAFGAFRGNVERSVASFWAQLVWLYISPFMGMLRRQAVVSNASTLHYPLFGALYGRSDGGKTTFSRIAVRSMFGIEQMMRGKDFTARKVEGLQWQLAGIPLVCDDVPQDKFRRHIAEVVKFDHGAEEHISGVVVSANQDVQAIPPELRKRMLVGKVDMAKLPSTSESPMRAALTGMGTALYRAFLARVWPKLLEAREDIGRDPANPPDVLAIASEDLAALFAEYRGQTPWAKRITLQDTVALETQPSLDIIHEMLETQPEKTKMDRRRGELSIQFDGDRSQALQFAKMMPAWAVKERLADIVRLDMAALEAELGFRASHAKWFHRLLGRG